VPFAKDDYVELVKYPHVVWQVTKPPKFNGGNPLYLLRYVGADTSERGARCRRKRGLATHTYLSDALEHELVAANEMLVLALESQ